MPGQSAKSGGEKIGFKKNEGLTQSWCVSFVSSNCGCTEECVECRMLGKLLLVSVSNPSRSP